MRLKGEIVPLSASNEHIRTTSRWPGVESSTRGLYVSIVSSSDGARFAAVAESEEACLAQIASYVAERTARELRPASIQRVNELLAAGEMAAAVTEYFRRTGERWDREWLVTTSLGPDVGSTSWSGTIPLPERTPSYEIQPHESLDLLGGPGHAERIARRAHER